MTQIITNTRQYNYASALFALLLWGGWSFYANYSDDQLWRGVISGVVQGICSFIITLMISHLVEKQFNFYHNIVLKSTLPPVCTVLLTGTCLVLIHHLIGTPNIFKTLVPVLTVAFLFACFTNFKLFQQWVSTPKQ